MFQQSKRTGYSYSFFFVKNFSNSIEICKFFQDICVSSSYVATMHAKLAKIFSQVWTIDNAGSSLSALIDLNSCRGFIHSNMHIFNLVRYIESCFAKHAALTDVFDLTIDEVISNYSFSFPCQEHAASDVLSYTICYYVRLRMRQYCYQKNQNIFKKSAVKRKLAKLTNE